MVLFHSVLSLLADTSVSSGGIPTPDADGDAITIILNIVWGITGGLALAMIVVSGLRYITSAGDPQKASGAKNGIIYALIGLVIATSARAIVAFVIGEL